MARQCYWDVGRWSDLWRVWRMAGDDRPIIDGIEFQVGCFLGFQATCHWHCFCVDTLRHEQLSIFIRAMLSSHKLSC